MSAVRESYGGVSVVAFGPLMILRFDPGWTTDELARAMRRVLELAPPRFAVISELRKVKPPGVLERKSISERLSPVEDEINRRVVVSAVVTDSMLVRGAIRAVRWLNPARYPVLTFESLGSAVQECASHLAREGVPLDAEASREAKIFAARMERDRQGQSNSA